MTVAHAVGTPSLAIFAGLAKLDEAVQAITQSPTFKRLLEVVLTLGNFLNQGSFRGNASGVKINFLGEMKSTKVSPTERIKLSAYVRCEARTRS